MEEKILNEFGQQVFNAAKARMVENGTWSPHWIATIHNLSYTLQELEKSTTATIEKAVKEIEDSNPESFFG